MNPILDQAKPIYEKIDGWHEDISGVWAFHELPPTAQAYVTKIEELVNCPIRYISVGPHRHAIIDRRQSS